MTASKPGNVSSVPQCIHCDAYGDLQRYLDRNENRVWLCRDGIACTRRAMAAQGITLLPHPKNPPGAKVRDA